METFLAAAMIFCFRVTDVSIGVVRVLYAVRGHRLLAASLGLVESGIFIVAISQIMRNADSPARMAAYALGFATGNYLGITIERWIASGTILARVVARHQCDQLLAALRARNFGVTQMNGSGREGEVRLYFIVAPRKRERELLRLVEDHSPDAFVTIEAVNRSQGGYLNPAAAVSVRK
jgi:uncharacterized protein YebE (UPF0316 family)